MRSHASPKESSSSASKPFFSRSSDSAAATTPFFVPARAAAAPDLQAQAEPQEPEEKLQTKESSEADRGAPASAPLPPEEPPAGNVQTKPAMGTPGDRFEREADRAADRVVQRFEAGNVGQDTPPPLQAKCAACDEEDKLRRQAEPDNAPERVETRPGASSGTDPESISETPTDIGDRHSSRGTRIQAKLTVTPPDDPEEREADQVAEKIMRMPAQEPAPMTGTEDDAGQIIPKGSGGTRPGEGKAVQAKCAECTIAPPNAQEGAEDREPDLTADPDKGAVNPKSEPSAEPPVPPADGLEPALRSSRGNGRPLPPRLRASMESKFGQDFSAVRIHANGGSAAMAKSIRAQAFTYGSDIFFNQNKFDPDSVAGQTLLAHELTHVIQQRGSHPLQRKIQRAEEVKLGNWAHHMIQERLRSRDDKLITEAGIPGGTRHGKKINSAGFADLYKSEGNQIAGVQAEIRGSAGDALAIQYSYKNFLKSGKRRANIRCRSGFNIGPTIKDGQWDFTHNFPSTFEVGEMKPLFPTEFTESLLYHGTGPLQLDSYLGGFEDFVAQAHKDIGLKIPASISGKAIDIPETNIPDSINYAKFEAEHARTDANAILKKDTHQRVWIYQWKPGLFLYFLIHHPYESQEFPDQVDKQLKKLDPLLKKLREKHPKMGTSLDTKPLAGSARQTATPPKIFRKRGNRIQAKDDDKWKTAATDWENQRKSWVNGGDAATPKPKKFLKEQAKGVEKKSKVDKELSLTPSQKMAEQAKQVKNIRFWSSFKGRIFGALYFRFRNTFDKVEELFAKIKEKFRKHRSNATKLNDKDGIFDNWKKVATKHIIKIAVDIFQKMIGIAFTGFMNCINAIVDGVVDKYIKAAEEAAEEKFKEIEPLCCGIMGFKTKFDTEIAKHEKTIQEFTEAVETIEQWREILNDVEIAVRVGVQVASCGTPPALGCLWGLVAQLGISAGLSLLTRTSYFDDYIAKPAAQSLMDAIVGDKLHNLMVDVLEGTPLKPHMEGLAPCARRSSGGSGGGGTKIGGHLDKLDPNDPAIAKARQEWEAEWKDEMLKDLQAVFETESKKPLSEEDFRKLVEAIKNANKTPEELKKMLEAARNAKSGKLSFDKALSNVASGAAPEEQPRERKIDYANAARNNPYYQNKIGWDPTTFIKKPGIQADSKEFADAVYDLQEAIGIHADGIAGAGTTLQFYKANGLPKDAQYNAAVQVAEQEQRAREERKAAAELKKEIEAILADKKVQEVLAKPFPSNEQLKKDLQQFDWDLLPGEGGAFVTLGGRPLIVLRTVSGARLGGYFKFVERDFQGTLAAMIVETGSFYALDEIPMNDSVTFSITERDGSHGLNFIFFKAAAKEAFFPLNPATFFGRFVVVTTL